VKNVVTDEKAVKRKQRGGTGKGDDGKKPWAQKGRRGRKKTCDRKPFSGDPAAERGRESTLGKKSKGKKVSFH